MEKNDLSTIDEGTVVVKGGVLPEASSQVPACYVALHGIQSVDNLGQLLRTAGAFGCREVLLVNKDRAEKRLKKIRTFGAHGAERRVPMRFFDDLDALVSFARRRDCEVVGIEIHDDAVPYAEAFREPRPTCFFPGNEGTGLSERQIALCDRLVYVPHFGAATASLNVNAATAIVLSAFATHAGYHETQRNGPKFHVVDPLHQHIRKEEADDDHQGALVAGEEIERQQKDADDQGA